VASRKFDQYFRAGVAGLVRETDEPVAQVVRDLMLTDNGRRNGDTSNGQRTAAGHLNEEKKTGSHAASSTGLHGENAHPPIENQKTRRTPDPKSRVLMYLQKRALTLIIISIGVSAFLGVPAWSTLAPVSVSVLSGWVVWRICVAQLNAWRHSDPSAETHPNPGDEDEDAQGLVRTLLLLAIAVSLLWLAWVRPTPRQDGLVIAVTIVLALGRSRWLERDARAFARRVLGPSARRLTRQMGLISGIQRLWNRVPAAAQVTVGLLLLLNILIALALLDTVKLSLGLWAIHTKMAFIVMLCVDALVLNLCLSYARQARSVSPQNHFSNFEFIEKSVPGRSRYNGHEHDSRLYLDEKEESTELQSAESIRTPAGKRPKFRWSRAPRFSGKFHPRLAAGLVILAAVWIGYVHPGLLLILAVVLVGSAILSSMEASRHQVITMILAVALGVATVDYIGWRFAVTNWQGWWIAVPLLCAEALGAAHILGFQFTVWPWPVPAIEPSEDPARHQIFMLVPTLNEGPATLRPTLDGCIAARRKYLEQYPDGQVTVVVCNDGRAADVPCWAEIDALAEELGVRCVTRVNGGGAKAGNIENARQACQVTGDALLAIFDADQVPKPDFLLKTVPPFADTKVGWVQTGQYYANLKNPVSRWADDQQSMFYNLLCPGKAALDSAFICGTNVVVRAAALDEIGGLPQDSVTEDFAASIALHPRWRSIYLTEILATGLGPLDIPSYLKQQGRWALGTLGVLRSNWRDIFLPRKNGLRAGQRVQYFLACTHYLCGLRDFIYLVSPVLFIFTGIPAVRTATLASYLLHFFPYAVLGITGMWYSARGVTGLRGIIIGFGSTPALIGSLVAVILGRKKSFAVTSKESQEERSLGYLRIYVFFVLLCLAALAWATQVKGRQQTSMFISLLWVVYSLLLLGSFLWLARADIRAHAADRQSGVTDVTAKQPYTAKLLNAPKRGLRPVVNLGFAALIASPVLLVAPLGSLPIFARPAAPFVITHSQADARYVGVSLPQQLLSSQPPILEHDLGIRFSIIGRTQDIADRFDTAWADQLAAQGARPWITLQFGNFGAGHKPPLTANLVAIYNGVDDPALRRWAVEIRDFGKPVYLTVLLQVDKNWAVSSAVANGGIPEDVPKAWEHIQSVFRAVGANNVAWVWAPADPQHDQPYAPPPSTISAVLQDFINYPGTHWGNPQQVLSSLIQRYPGKPIIVEVSSAGPAARKAAWLATLGQAVDDCPQVYALLYHEGGPVLKPTATQLKSWSEASDPASLAAWRLIVTGLHAGGRLP
jgi:cellulose synthase/poly-beta-1,6-N-acetylglucosamine synthase-like glycosyltransferase